MRIQRTALVILNFFLCTGIAIAGEKSNAMRALETDVTAIQRYMHDTLEKMQPALESAGGASRLYYSTPCNYPERLVGFPKLTLRSGSSNKTGVAAVRYLFANDKNVKVSNSPGGIVRITVGNASRDFLKTRIELLRLNSQEQYNPIAAILAIEANESVKQAARNLGLHQPPTIVSENPVAPAPTLPHLPATLRGVTLDEALDAIARTFKGLVIYGECQGHGASRSFTIAFAWIVEVYSI